MNRLREFPLVYLATPYTKYEPGIHHAFVEAARIAAAMMKDGVKVYSPISHTHPLALYGNLDPLDHNIWLPFDQAMMNVSAALVVATMGGWERSFGVRHEIEWFAKADRPVYFLNPESMVVRGKGEL